MEFLDGVQDAVGLDGLQSLSPRQAAAQTIPGSGVAMPLQVKAVAADPVHSCEWRFKFFPLCFWLR